MSAAARPLRLALLGSRGIPARYGGYETLMEELGPRLAARGHDVTVYGRSHFVPPGISEHRGCRIVVLPTVRSKHLDTPVHMLVSALHAAERAYDAALVVNSANAIFVPLLRAASIPVALHVDGSVQAAHRRDVEPPGETAKRRVQARVAFQRLAPHDRCGLVGRKGVAIVLQHD